MLRDRWWLDGANAGGEIAGQLIETPINPNIVSGHQPICRTSHGDFQLVVDDRGRTQRQKSPDAWHQTPSARPLDRRCEFILPPAQAGQE